MDALEELQLARWIRAEYLLEEDLNPYGERIHAEVLLARVSIIDVAQNHPPLVVEGKLSINPAEALTKVQEFSQYSHAVRLMRVAQSLALLVPIENGWRLQLSSDVRQVAEKIRQYHLGQTIRIGGQDYNKNQGRSLAHDEGDEF